VKYNTVYVEMFGIISLSPMVAHPSRMHKTAVTLLSVCVHTPM